MTAQLPTRKLWRVRAWVLVVAVTVPVLFLSTTVWPSAFNPGLDLRPPGRTLS